MMENFSSQSNYGKNEFSIFNRAIFSMQQSKHIKRVSKPFVCKIAKQLPFLITTKTTFTSL